MFIGNIEFARKVGSKDKTPRKKRNLKKLGAKIAGSAVGSLAAGYALSKIGQKVVPRILDKLEERKKVISPKKTPRFRSDGYMVPQSKTGGLNLDVGDTNNTVGRLTSQILLKKAKKKRK